MRWEPGCPWLGGADKEAHLAREQINSILERTLLTGRSGAPTAPRHHRDLSAGGARAGGVTRAGANRSRRAQPTADMARSKVSPLGASAQRNLSECGGTIIARKAVDDVWRHRRSQSRRRSQATVDRDAPARAKRAAPGSLRLALPPPQLRPGRHGACHVRRITSRLRAGHASAHASGSL